MKVSSKVFVVTGAGGGIGGAVAKELIANGVKVAAVDLNEDGLRQLQNEVGDDLVSVHTLNITDRDAVAKLPDEVVAAHGQVDGLINVAGIIQPFVKINELEFESVERVMNVNFYGTLNMTKAFLPKLLERPEAHVTNVSSMGGFFPFPGQSIYGASKAAVKIMTEGLYAELMDTNVDVTVVFPGATNTKISENSGVASPSADAGSGMKMTSAEDAAKEIVKGMEKGKLQVYTGKDAKMMNKLYRLKPTFAIKTIAKKMKSLTQ